MEYVVCNFIPHLQAVICNIRHCKLKQQLCGHTGAVFAVDLDEKAKLAYTGSGDKVNHCSVLILHAWLQFHLITDNQAMGGSHWTMY